MRKAKITLRDVAAKAGASPSAVSRAFTDGASVSPAMRARVEAAAAALGYRPNALASSLTTGRSKLIGLVANNFQNPVFLEIFDQFTRGLQQMGLRPLLVNLSDVSDIEQAAAMLRQYSVDGVVVASSTLPAGLVEQFYEEGVPVVHAFGRHDPQARVNVVGIDNHAAGRLAGETLIARGYREIGFLGGPEGATSTQDRLAGFRAALAEAGLSCRARFVPAYRFEAGQAAMSAELSAGPAEVYFCGDDILSIGAMAAIGAAGLGCPDDIGILGLNDMAMAAWPNMRLTTIAQPIEAIVGAALSLVVRLSEYPSPQAEAQMFPCHLVERASLRALNP